MLQAYASDVQTGRATLLCMAPAPPCLQEGRDVVLLLLRGRMRMRAVRPARAGGPLPEAPRPGDPVAVRCGGSAAQAIARAGAGAGIRG